MLTGANQFRHGIGTGIGIGVGVGLGIIAALGILTALIWLCRRHGMKGTNKSLFHLQKNPYRNTACVLH